MDQPKLQSLIKLHTCTKTWRWLHLDKLVIEISLTQSMPHYTFLHLESETENDILQNPLQLWTLRRISGSCSIMVSNDMVGNSKSQQQLKHSTRGPTSKDILADSPHVTHVFTLYVPSRKKFGHFNP